MKNINKLHNPKKKKYKSKDKEIFPQSRYLTDTLRKLLYIQENIRWAVGA